MPSKIGKIVVKNAPRNKEHGKHLQDETSSKLPAEQVIYEHHEIPNNNNRRGKEREVDKPLSNAEVSLLRLAVLLRFLGLPSRSPLGTSWVGSAP